MSRKEKFRENMDSMYPLLIVLPNDLSGVKCASELAVGSKLCIVDRLAHKLFTDGLEMSIFTTKNDIVKLRWAVMTYVLGRCDRAGSLTNTEGDNGILPSLLKGQRGFVTSDKRGFLKCPPLVRYQE